MGSAIRLSKILFAAFIVAALFIEITALQPAGAEECYECPGDIDHDGVVDGSDLATFAGDYGETNCCTGISANAIYVSNSHPAAADTDEAGLSPFLPTFSISYGILRAVQTGRSEVRVAAGLYEESVSLQNGISLLGGYDPATWQRSWAAYPTIIKGSSASGHRAAVAANCESIDVPTVFEGFVVFGEDADGSGENSYGIYLVDCRGDFVIRNNVIRAGSGGDGARGDNGSQGSDGTMGTDGMDALDLYVTYGVFDHTCTSANHSAGGSAGVSTCGAVSTSGGDGGNRICPDYDGTETTPPVASEFGQDGLNGGGSGGAAGRDVFHAVFSCEGYQIFGSPLAEDGQNGPDGNNGAAGSGCSGPNGFVSAANHWIVDPAYGGGDGTSGGGGGGGGSGAGAWVHDSCYAKGFEYDNLGGTGGGGGSGGCGAYGGSAGAGGGGSFGIFVLLNNVTSYVPDIRDNVIHTADGGKGGDGGNGGTGGVGGTGGSGGSGSTDPFTDPPDPVYPAFPGGNGGEGGDGGHGGGGGGGCGGVSYGIYLYAHGGSVDISAWQSQNTFDLEGSGGSGGYGGASAANPGTNGQTGASGAAESTF